MEGTLPEITGVLETQMLLIIRRAMGANPKGNGCFECGAPGHFKRDYPKLKNKDGGDGNAQGWVYAVGNAEKRGNVLGNPDSNVVTGTFLLNNHYASILFYTSADRSFISNAFSSLINIAPTPLENNYDVELADSKIVRIDTIIRGCTLNFLDHPFNIDLMPKQRDRSRLTQYSFQTSQGVANGQKGCQIFLAQISTKKEEDKSEGKKLKDIPIARDFPEVFFPWTCQGVPTVRPVEFQIDLIPGAAPVARAPYRLAPAKMKELSKQLQELSDKGFIRPIPLPWEPQSCSSEKKEGINQDDEKEHEQHLKEILELLKEEKLGIHMDPAKIESIKDWASPKTPTKIRQFLCLAGYYRRFIEGFSKIAKLMTKLTQKGIKFDWGEKEENAFQSIKQKLCSAPILALPEGSKDFVVYCDASHKGLGVVLM
ncbi:putative reverse transcriptase domain-containing protein [Tanacetum coccineum]